MEGVIRLRLTFKDPNILTGLQKSQGLEQSWFLLKPQHKTISDISNYILHTFQIHHSCPHGLQLSMDGFVLPPSETTCILKDNDVVSVTKKGGVLAIDRNHAPSIAENIKIVEKQPVNTGPLLLANEEFDNESGGYESEEPENESEDKEEADPVKDSSRLKNSLGSNVKKRKALETLPSSKKKKHCSGVSEKVDEQTKKSQQDLTSKKSACKQKKVPDPDNKDADNNKEGAESSKINDSISGMKKNNKLQEDGVENVEANPKPDRAKKGPSRSSRRQYAKRLLIRELLTFAKNAASESGGLANAGSSDGNLPSERHFNGETDGRPKGRWNWKQQQNKAKNQEMNDQPKGLLHWKESREDGKGRHTNKEDQTNEKSTLGEEVPGQDSNMGDEVVPVVVRPGHIRFEPLPKDQDLQQDQVQVGGSQFNGITSKEKGQKKGQEKMNASVNSTKEHPEMLDAEKEACFQESIDFNTLPFLSGPPKEGHVIAYRLLELSATWTAGLSSYRVGKVSRYSPEAGRVLLTQVAEYPLFSDEDKCSMHHNDYLYKEDGSLEIDFTSLLEVRLIKNDSSDSVAGISSWTSKGPATNESNPVLITSEKKTDAPAIENGLNLWEQFSEPHKVKSVQLSEEGSWGKWSSAKSSWSQRVQSSEETSWGKGRGSSGRSSWLHGASRGRGRGRGGSEESSWGGRSSWSHGASRGRARGRGRGEENSWVGGSSGQSSWSHGASRGRARGRGRGEESSWGGGSSGQSSWSHGASRGRARGRGRS